MSCEPPILGLRSERRCFVRAGGNERIAALLSRIPGAGKVGIGVWSVELGPDRAEAVGRLLAAFPEMVRRDEDAERIEALRRRRDLVRPVIELAGRGRWKGLSLCEDWSHAGVFELEAIRGAAMDKEIGRILVPLTAVPRSSLVGTLVRHGLEVSPAVAAALDEPLGLAVASGRGAQRPTEPVTWRADLTADQDSAGRPVFTVTTRRGEPPESLPAAELAMTDEGRRLVERLAAGHSSFHVHPRARACLRRLEAGGAVPPAIVALTEQEPELTGPGFAIRPLWDLDAGATADLPEATLASRWDPEYLHSVTVALVPADPSSAPDVAAWVAEREAEVEPAAALMLERLQADNAAAEPLVYLSQADDAVLDVAGLDGELMPFQRAGILYALRTRRAFIADEQGLGKTVQALGTLQAAGAWPAVVLCPASLKLNWEREAARWLPDRSCEVARGGIVLGGADLSIVSYEVLHSYVDGLIEARPRAVVLDESHYCKNPSARRTKAALRLAEGLDDDALRLALTGTPLVNRPAELVPQLRILGRLEQFGSGAAFERRFGDPRARERLHWNLRRSCYVRRRKAQVLKQLPAKRRVTVPVPLSDEAGYRRLEDDFWGWLRDSLAGAEEGKGEGAALDPGVRGEAIVRLGVLRREAARGKLDACIDWIDSFLASGAPLVVFAHHREVQERLAGAFPGCSRVLGTSSVEQRQSEVERFQDPGGPLLCVCSLQVAAHGLTLTRAADVAFVEIGWTPGGQDQAEDRVHRIGQDRGVTAWYLLAADSIDERIVALLDAKRAVVGSVTDGSASSEESLLTGLAREAAAA